MPIDEHARSNVWTRYWASGAQHSCAGSFASNYDGDIAAFWRDVAGTAPSDARVLDIACGNGPVTRLMSEHGSEFEIDAVDLAQVQPMWWRELPTATQRRIRFHSGVAAETLPFADSSFALAVSQFGIEYSDLEQSLPELRRVLVPDGRIGLILHARESLIVRRAQDELPHYEWLREQDELWRLADRLCGPMARAATEQGRQSLVSDVQATADRSEFNRKMQEISERATTMAGNDILHDVQQGIANALGMAGRSGDADIGRDQLRSFVQALHDGELRQRELIASARSEAEAAEVAARIDARVETLRAVIFSNGELLGWGLHARLRD